MRKFSALAVVSLLGLTGCAAPTVAESAPATVTVTAAPESQEQAATTPEPSSTPGELREMAKSEFDRNIGSMQKNLSYIGIGSKDFPKAKLVAEIEKVCAQHFDYDGLPISGATDADNGRFIQVANNMFC